MQPKYPLAGEWINKIWSIYTMQGYSATLKNDVLTLATTRMKREDTLLSQGGHSLYDSIYKEGLEQAINGHRK